MKTTIAILVVGLAMTACGTSSPSVTNDAVSSSSLYTPSIASVEFKNVVSRQMAGGVDLVAGDRIIIHGSQLGNSLSQVCSTDGNPAHDYCLSGDTVVDSQQETLTFTLNSALRAPFGTGIAVISATGRGSNLPNDGLSRTF